MHVSMKKNNEKSEIFIGIMFYVFPFKNWIQDESRRCCFVEHFK